MKAARLRSVLPGILLSWLLAAMPSTASDLPPELRKAAVTAPRAWLDVVDAMTAANRQTGIRYAVVPPAFEGVAGPFTPGTQIPLEKFLENVAAASATKLRFINNTAVFEPSADAGLPSGRDDKTARLLALILAGTADTVQPLSSLAADDDPSIRFQALAALHRLEGDFMRNSWPGRISIFEVLKDKLDRDSLFFALLECYPAGAPGWLMTVDVLARAREPYLARNTWEPVWYLTPGTIPLGMWSLGRSGDHTALPTLAKRVKRYFTNEPADRFLAAAAMAQLDIRGERLSQLAGAEGASADVKTAVLYGMGLCTDSAAVMKCIEQSLENSDARVQFMACQALGRIASTGTIARLANIVKDETAPLNLKSAALEGLGLADGPESAALITGLSASPEPVIRAKAADLLGRRGGVGAMAPLAGLITDSNPVVRASAAFALGSLGTSEAVTLVESYLAGATADDDGRIAAYTGLGRGMAPESVRILAPVACNPKNPLRLRQYAVSALTRLARRSGQGTLKSLTVYDTPEYMPLALRYLDLGKPSETFAYVQPYLARGFTDTSAAAACRLAELGYGPGILELLKGSDVFENHARMMHIWGAIRAQGPDVIPTLVEAAKNRRTDIRTEAALALGGRIDPRAVDALILLTRDPSSSVRSAAAQSLGLCGDPKAIPVLTALAATDTDDNVYSTCIRSLRLNAFKGNPEVKTFFAGLAGTSKDAGVINPAAPSITDQPPNSFVLRRFAGTEEEDDMCNVTYETSLVYDSGRGRSVLWGAHGRRKDSPQTGETWFYDAARSSWERLTSSREIPNGACCVIGTVYDPANRLVISPMTGSAGGHGWLSQLRAHMQFSVPWIMDTTTDQWYPVRPLRHKGPINETGASFDARSGTVFFWFGKCVAYDAYANEWRTVAGEKDGPPGVKNAGAAFDPETGRLIVVAPDSTWALDTATSSWTDLRPEGGKPPAGARMVYDSDAKVMLVFAHSKEGGTGVWAYKIAANRWEKMPPSNPSPRYGGFDVAYDSKNKVCVISGGEQTGRSGEAVIRETWTYRYAAAGTNALTAQAPDGLALRTEDGGKVAISWNQRGGVAPAKYRIYRGNGSHPAQITWTAITNIPGTQCAFEEQVAAGTNGYYYRVSSLDAAGMESTVSFPVRTDPPAPRWVTATAVEGGIRLTWQTNRAASVAGYHIYRIPVPAGSYWEKEFDPMRLEGKPERITKEPVNEAVFTDTGAKITGTPSEFAWPGTYAYIVRAVNLWGQEGGGSPVTLAVPDSPALVTVIPWIDGRRLLLWAPPRSSNVEGYTISRMDDWNGSYVFRLNASPVRDAGFNDTLRNPVSDRRLYFISGVDRLGTVGIPSPGVWSHGFP